jgi:hypothetical protein
MQLLDDSGSLGSWELMYGFGGRKIASSEDFENCEYEEHTAYLIVKDCLALNNYHMKGRSIEINQVVFCWKVCLSEIDVRCLLRGEFFDPKHDGCDGVGGKLVRFNIIPKYDRNPLVTTDRFHDIGQIRIFTYSAMTGMNRITAKMYDEDEPEKNAKFGIYRLGSTWIIRRQLWIGKLKENEDYCQLARLPKDIIKEIDSHLYPPVLSIRNAAERKCMNLYEKYRPK